MATKIQRAANKTYSHTQSTQFHVTVQLINITIKIMKMSK
jgi:hypothetical protein